LFGTAPAVETGLTGNRMPGSKNQPQPMKFETAQNWFTADGIPATPFDDNGNKNYYPMMRLTAADSTGKVLATTNIVLPVSDELDCKTCHASGSNAAARPRAGWVFHSMAERDFKLNVLRRHDDRRAGTTLFQNALAANKYNSQGLYETVVTDGRPVLCAACHGTNALGAAGQPGVSALTSAIHASHAGKVDPVSGTLLDDSTNRGACYRCHPGSETKCLRGVMGNSATADGTLAIQCQNCHGSMSAVGDPARQGWLNEPGCQNCHSGTATVNAGQIRFTSALDASGKLRAPRDSTYATQANVPAAGLSLYRFSAGHGGLQCEACHGSTHAEYPSSHANDNVQSTDTQGHTGTLAECTACHATSDPNISQASLNGPHGMHPLGQTWVSQHPNFTGRNTARCAACHGADFRGTVLSRAYGNRTVNAFGTSTYWRGFQMGCYTCHNGPGTDNRNSNSAPVVNGGKIATAVGAAASMAIVATDANGGNLTLWAVSQPANGTVGLKGNTATLLPNPGFEGSDSFTVAAWDGMTSSNLATVAVQVTANARPQFAASTVQNAASFQAGPIAPGEVLSIFGSGLGPATATGLAINSAGLVNRSLGGTRVLFDGVAAPILYASAGQVNLVAPWSLAGKTSSSVQVEYGGIRSNALPVSVAGVAPAIFPGAVVNQDGSVNGSQAPAARGSVLILYAMGGGVMSFTPLDGAVASASQLATPAGSVTVQVGGVDAVVMYAGDAPGLVSGVLQVNVRLAAATPIGNSVPLVLQVGGVAAPAVNVAVK
ncbi:MAG: Ig-like domain-containing protein, partial [Candidatus Solibacter sp.]|nr:Ig-like domain-containing protein [Candidatus Solibacter sp.]